jgi:hypothetical protein
MISLMGQHGTSVNNSESIERDGFKRSDGIRGRGVYFWRDDEYAEALARDSHRARLADGGFRGQANMACAVIKVTIKTAEESFIDFTAGEWRARLVKYFAALNEIPVKNRHKALGEAYNLFFYKLKQAYEHELTVVCLFVPAPVRKGAYPVDVLGHPCCYLVMDESKINISGVSK